MKHSFLFVLIVLIGFNSACEKSASQLCGGDDPVATLPWLKDETNRLSSSEFCYSISRALYKNKPVFIVSICEPNVDGIPFLFDCDGNKLNLTGEDYRNLNFTGDMELIWKNR